MRYFILGISIIVAAASCGRTTTGPSETTTSEGQRSEAPAGSTASSQGVALLRFMNADPTGRPRELGTMDGHLFTDIAYKAITPYVEIPTDRTRFFLRETGAAEDLEVNHTELLTGRHYTLVAAPTPKGTSRLLVLRDDLRRPEPGKAYVRVINATTGVDNLDLYVAGTDKKIEKGVDAAESTDFMEVGAGTFEIHPARQAAVPRLSKLQVEGGRLYTFVVIGKAGDLDAVVITDQLNPAHSEAAPR